MVFIATSLLVLYAATVFATTLFKDVGLERFYIKLGELSYLVHLQVAPHPNCIAPFPQSRHSNISVIVDEANTRPPPVLVLQTKALAQIQLLAPVDLPNATFSKTKSCFLFQGEKGYLHIRMESPVSDLTGISFDYSHFQHQLDPVYHPREVSMWGLHQGSASPEGVQEHLRSLAVDNVTRRGRGNDSYILIAKGLLNPMRDVCMSLSFSELLRSSSFEAFVIQISSNWGGDHTCLAPFRLYVQDLEGSV